MAWEVRSHCLEGKRRSTRRLNCVLQIWNQWATPAVLWPMKTIWLQDGAKLADCFGEGSLTRGKEAELMYSSWHALATVAAGMDGQR